MKKIGEEPQPVIYITQIFARKWRKDMNAQMERLVVIAIIKLSNSTILKDIRGNFAPITLIK
jgi:hypothetical protein